MVPQTTKRTGARLILVNREGLVIKVSPTLSFSTSNSQAEFEACISVSLKVEFSTTVCVVNPDQIWITLILRYIKVREELAYPKSIVLARKRASSYSVIKGKLFC